MTTTKKTKGEKKRRYYYNPDRRRGPRRDSAVIRAIDRRRDVDHTSLPVLRGVEARNALAESNRGLVMEIAKRACKGRRLSGDVVDDCIQAGWMGLLRAAETWDETRGVSFCTYAWPWITRGVVLSLRQWRQLIRIPLCVDTERTTVPRTSSLRGCERGDDGDRRMNADPHRPCDDPRSRFSTRRIDEDREHWETIIRRECPPREADICIRMIFEAASLTELGIELGVSRERIRQLFERAKKRILPYVSPRG